MDILSITGDMPGGVVATVAHRGRVHQLGMELGRNPAGGWRARRGDGAWGPRCHSATTAVLLEAGEALSEASLAEPALS